jgi:hypothetical protein
MSARVNNRDFSRNKYAAEKTVKKYCGVCHKAGLTEKEYTSHFTKSTPGEKGIVICPTILNNECSFCYQKGHFKTACPAIADRQRMEKKRAIEDKRQYYKQQENEVRANSEKKTANGGFAALYQSDDSDEEAPITLKRTHSVANEIKEEWPALSTVAAKPVVAKQSFASVAANPLPVKKTEPICPTICGFTVITKQGVQHPLPKPVIETKHRSWADLSEDEEEEEDNYETYDNNDDDAW